LSLVELVVSGHIYVVNLLLLLGFWQRKGEALASMGERETGARWKW